MSVIPGSITSHNTLEDPPRFWALVTLFFAPAFIFANMYTTQAILPELSKAFSISAPTAGLTVSVLVLAVALGSLFYGPLSDRVGRKPVMVGVSFLVIVPTLLCGLAPNFAMLVAFRALQGLLMPGLTSVAISYVNEEFAGKMRGLAMGIYVSGLTLGGLFARGGSAVLASLYDWRIAMLAFAFPTLIAALILWRFLPETNSRKVRDVGARAGESPETRVRAEAKDTSAEASDAWARAGINPAPTLPETNSQRVREMGARTTETSTKARASDVRARAGINPTPTFSMDSSFVRQTLHDMGLHLRNRRLVGAFIIGFSSFFAFIGIFTYLPYYLTGPAFRLPTIALGLVYLLWLTGVFSPAAGAIAARTGSRRAIFFTMGLGAIGLLITLVPLLPVVMFGLGLLTIGMFSTVPAVNLYLGEQATTAKGTAASMYLSLYYLGGSIGAVLPGFALLWAGWHGVVFLCLGMVAIALASDVLLCK